MKSPDPAEPPESRTTATPVSADDVKRVVGQALAAGTRRIRLTYGQRRAIVNTPRSAGGARA